MKYIEWGKEKRKVSEVCLGTMLMGSVMNKEDSFRALDHFMEIGGNFIDTANCYAWWTGTGENVGDESELLVGEWFKTRKNRDKVILSTKVGARIDPKTVVRNPDGTVDWANYDAWNNYEGLHGKTIIESVEGSLKRLGVDYIDIYLAHIDYRSVPLEETLEAFDQLVRQGKVRHTGGSNMETWRLEEARQISRIHGWAPYEVIQNEYAYLRPRQGSDFGKFPHAGRDMMEYLSSKPEIMHMAYSPLLKGILANGKKPESIYLWPQFASEDTRKRLETLNEVAEETGSGISQVALAWMLAQKTPKTIPVLGFSRMEQYRENIAALDISLTEEQIKKLDTAGE